MLVGTFTRYPVRGRVATLGIVLAALYILLMVPAHRCTGPVREGRREGSATCGGREMLAIAPLIVVIVALGFYPKPLLDVINPAVDHVMHAVGATDPAPAVRLPVSLKGRSK